MPSRQVITAPTCSKCGVRKCAADRRSAGGFRKKCWKCKDPNRRLGIRWKHNIKKKFGMTPEQYEKLISDHGGVCAICKKPETRTRNGKPTKLCVDHCHASGMVRGPLCSRCNFMVGLVEQDPGVLNGVAEYLARYGTPTDATKNELIWTLDTGA